MTVRILGMLTTRQKQHLNEEIATYIKDFRKLNAAPENGGAIDDRLRENASEKYAMPL
jgi:hypothetical protein